MKRFTTWSLVLTVVALAMGCAPYRIETPTSFVELEQRSHSSFAYRAATADGVVVGLRALDNDRRATLEFWTEAVRNKLRDGRGYELQQEQDVTARGGIPGKQMHFARDDAGHSYRYWVSVFVRHEGRKPRIWILEAGGLSEPFEARQQSLESMLATFEPR